LLGSDKLRVINEAVLVLVVALQDRVDHVLKLVICEYFLLGLWIPGLGVMVGLVVPVDQGLDKLQSVQLVVAVSVVHLEVVELELLLCHLGRINVLNVLLHVLSLLGYLLLVFDDSPLLWLSLALGLLWLALELLLRLPLELLLLRLSLELLLRLTLKLLLGLSLELLLLRWGRRASLELLRRRLALELLGLTLELLLWLALELLLLRRRRLTLELLLLLILLRINPRDSPLLPGHRCSE